MYFKSAKLYTHTHIYKPKRYTDEYNRKKKFILNFFFYIIFICFIPTVSETRVVVVALMLRICVTMIAFCCSICSIYESERYGRKTIPGTYIRNVKNDRFYLEFDGQDAFAQTKQINMKDVVFFLLTERPGTWWQVSVQRYNEPIFGRGPIGSIQIWCYGKTINENLGILS